MKDPTHTETISLTETISRTDRSRRNLRARLRKQRRDLDLDVHQAASREVVRRIQTTFQFLNAKHIGTYWQNDGEINLRGLQTRASQLQYLPVLQESVWPWAGRGLLFGEATQPLLKNDYGIPEPVQTTKQIFDLDFVLVPLVGFDRIGNRLGMGGGYYDRALSKDSQRTVFKLGVAYSFQEVPSIQGCSWDVKLDGIVTEKEIIFTNP